MLRVPFWFLKVFVLKLHESLFYSVKGDHHLHNSEGFIRGIVLVYTVVPVHSHGPFGFETP